MAISKRSERDGRGRVKPSFEIGLAISGLALVGLSVLGVGSSGCTVNHDDEGDDGIVAPGTLALSWTLDESNDPSECTQSSATTLQLSIFYSDGTSAGVLTPSCASGETSTMLPPGNYTATAVLLGANGQNRTTSIPVDGFHINSNVQLNIPIDFPADSFE